MNGLSLNNEVHMNVTDQEIKEILLKYKKLVVLGLSPDSSKASNEVPTFLRSQGYDPVGIYPKETNISGFKIYQSLQEVPAEYRKFVDVFRRSEAVPQIVDEVLKVGGVEVLWLQLGVSHPEAEKKAEAAGIKVISNRCPHIEFNRLMH